MSDMSGFRSNHLRLAADLLDVAAERFSHHGCNDLKWPDYITAEDRLAMLDAFKAGNPDHTAEEIDGAYSPGDWLVMLALARMMRQAAGDGAR